MNTTMNGLPSRIDFEELRQYLYQLKSIKHVQIVPDDDGQVMEVHVITDCSRSAKQVARDIQSVALARFDLRIDHKLISIAQINVDSDPGAPQLNRLVPEQFSLSLNSNQAEAKVILSYENNRYEGQAQGQTGSRQRSVIVAQATLEAVHRYLAQDNIFSLLEVKSIPISDQTVTLVCLSVNSCGRQDLLVGTAIVRDDPQMTIVRATLDAMNRRLPFLIQ